jgi:serine/threonine protein kinase
MIIYFLTLFFSTGTMRFGSCAEKVLITKYDGVFSEAKEKSDSSGQLELQIRLLRELRILQFIQHHNLVKLVDTPAPASLIKFRDVYIVTELPDADLSSLLNSSRVKFDDRRIMSFIYQTLCATHYLHSANIIQGYVI